MAKLDKMQRFIPSLYKPTTNPYVRGLLDAYASEDDRIVAAVQNAKEQLFVKYAKFQFLDALGSNVGVFRPTQVNLADEQFRQLIPTLSYSPKQIIPTIKKVLDVFFTPNNPRVFVREINPNEIVIQIPSSVSSLRREIKGSHHFKVYSGEITAIDNILKTLTVDLDSTTKTLLVDEWAEAFVGQGSVALTVLSNTTGNTGVTVQFSASDDLSVYSTGRFVVVGVPHYPGSFIPDPRRNYSVKKQRGILGQTINAGSIYPAIVMQDASGIPDEPGRLVFNFGRGTEEGDIRYFGRPNNTTLILDPSYNFSNNHSIGEMVNVIVKPYQVPRIDGSDYSVYLVGITAARILAQQIVQSVVAAGVVIRWIISEPEC